MKPVLLNLALASGLLLSPAAFAQSGAAMMGGTSTSTSPSAQSSMNGSDKNDVSGASANTSGNAVQPPQKGSSANMQMSGTSSGNGASGLSTGSMGNSPGAMGSGTSGGGGGASGGAGGAGK